MFFTLLLSEVLDDAKGGSVAEGANFSSLSRSSENVCSTLEQTASSTSNNTRMLNAEKGFIAFELLASSFGVEWTYSLSLSACGRERARQRRMSSRKLFGSTVSSASFDQIK